MDLKEQIEVNRLYAFACYVRDWKKQDVNTIQREGQKFSYTTKKGKKKSFVAVHSPLDADVRVQGFFFKALENQEDRV